MIHTQTELIEGADPLRIAQQRYLDLMKGILTRAIVATGIERQTVRPWGPKSKLVHKFNSFAARWGFEVVRLAPTVREHYVEPVHESDHRVEGAETMLGTAQLDRMQRCIEDVLENNVPGDLLEAGVWRGGMTIFMRAVLAAHQVMDRKVWVVDSFAGLPPIDRSHETYDWKKGDMAIGLEVVKQNFERYGLLDEQVEFLKGYFSDTLPSAPIGQLAILRADADLYGSTLDILRNLYGKLSPGGYAVFDDYQQLADCKRAVDEFRSENGITEPIVKIDGQAVYWQKRG